MALELKQSMKLVQQLVMTPQLQQAIKLLQLSRLELVSTVNQEIQENPLLEEVNPEAEDRVPGEAEPQPSRDQDPMEIRGGDEGIRDINWDEYMQNYEYYPRPMASPEEPGRGLEAVLSEKSSLVDHLIWQLRMSPIPKEEQATAEMIIGNLNEDGYLDCSLEEIAQAAGVEVGLAERVLHLVQEFDPVGVAARDLQECLILQVRKLEMDGTLVETEALWADAGRSVLEGLDVAVPEDAIERLHGVDLDATLRLLADDYGVVMTPEDFVTPLLDAVEAGLADARPRVGAAAWIDAVVAARLPRAIVSNSPGRMVEATLAPHPWARHLRVRISVDDVARGKPAPDLYRLAARRLGVDPSSCLALEDSLVGARAAVAAGTTCVLVTFGVLDPAAARRVTPFVVDDLPQALALVAAPVPVR